MRTVLNVVLAAAALLMVSVAFAKPNEPVSSRGEGTYKLDGQRRSIERVSLQFKSENRYVIKMQLEGGDEVEFTGRYSGDGYHRDIQIRHGLGAENADGDGEMWVEDNTGKLKKFKAHGEVKGKDFKIEFEARNNRSSDDRHDGAHHGNRDDDNDHGHGHGNHSSWDAAGNEFSFADSFDGKGHVEYSGERHRLTHLRVKMSRNGDLSLRFEGPDMPDEVWEGRWWGTGPNYSVDLRNHSTYSVHASGILTLSNDNRRFKEINVNGRDHGESFSLDFKAESNRD